MYGFKIKFYQSIFLLLLVSFFAKNVAHGQVHQSPARTLSITGAYSPYSVKILGKTPDSQTHLLEINYNQRLKSNSQNWDIYYSVGLIPYIYYSFPRRDKNNFRDHIQGFGIEPVGFSFLKVTNSDFKPYITTSTGIILTDRDFPTDKAQSLNFTIQASIGMRISVLERLDWNIGYKFHHISNAQTGRENPGIDSNFIYSSIIFHSF